jgi:hypothetical protein
MENYGAISFTGKTLEGPFDEQILAGRKTQTIRYPRKDDRPHVKVGYTTKLYWKMRTKQSRLIGYAEIIAYEKTTLMDMWFDEENAKADGFKDLEEFHDWFMPEWDGLPEELKQAFQVVGDTMHVSIGRKFGKSTLLRIYEELLEPVYRIKWKYPLAEVPVGKFSNPICDECTDGRRCSENCADE